MTDSQILHRITAHKNGQYLSIKSNKDLGGGVICTTKRVARVGVTYANMSANKDRQTGKLPYGSWMEGYEGMVLEHKGKKYLRVTSAYPDTPERDIISRTYSHNGQKVPREQAEALAEQRLSKVGMIQNIPFENILEIK